MDSVNVPLNTGSHVSNRNLYATTYTAQHLVESTPNEIFNDETFHDLRSSNDERNELSDEYYDDNNYDHQKASFTKDNGKLRKQKAHQSHKRRYDGLGSGPDDDNLMAQEGQFKNMKSQKIVKRKDQYAQKTSGGTKANPIQSPPTKRMQNFLQSNQQEPGVIDFNTYYEKQSPYKFGYNPEFVKPQDDIWSRLLILLSYVMLVVSFPFSLCACIKVAQEYERAVVFRLGRIIDGGHKGPGIFFVLPCVDTYLKVDLRTVTFDVPPQEILTKDSVTVSVDAVVYFRIFNAVISVINVEDASKSTKLLAASTLRNVLGTKSLHEILSDRETVASLIQSSLLAATSPWGVQVERVEVKDVRLPIQLQRAMATEAEAAREARAKVIAAEGEKKASYALKDAALVISQTPTAIQLRYLQTLTTIAAEHNSTIVFPIPLELLSYLQVKQHEQNPRYLPNSNTQATVTNENLVSKSSNQQINRDNSEITLKPMSIAQSEI